MRLARIGDDGNPVIVAQLLDKQAKALLQQRQTIARLHRTRGFSIGELSIIFRDRDLGRSKIDFPIILEAVWGVLRLRLSGR